MLKEGQKESYLMYLKERKKGEKRNNLLHSRKPRGKALYNHLAGTKWGKKTFNWIGGGMEEEEMT